MLAREHHLESPSERGDLFVNGEIVASTTCPAGGMWKKLAAQLPLPSEIDFSIHFLAFVAICTNSMPPAHKLSNQDTPCFFHKPLESRQDFFTKIFQPHPRASEEVRFFSFSPSSDPA